LKRQKKLLGMVEKTFSRRQPLFSLAVYNPYGWEVHRWP